MASSIKLYTTGNMDAAKVHAVTSEATGYPAENAIDNNLDTYWKATTTASTQRLDLDLGEAKTIDSVVLFFKNYTTVTGAIIGLYRSSDGSAWTGIKNLATPNDATTPIRIDTFTAISYRYWRLNIGAGASEVIKLAGVWWGSYYNIAQGNMLPQEDEDQFYNRISRLPGGRLAVAGINRNHVENFSRRYLVKAGTPYNNLLNAFRDSRGIRHLLAMNEDAAQSDARIVRFADDILPRPTVGYNGLYEIEIGLRGVPYIDDGDSY